LKCCAKGGHGGKIKYFPPIGDDNTSKEQGVHLHTGEYKLLEKDVDGLKHCPSYPFPSNPSTPLVTPKRETCAVFVEEEEEEEEGDV
jgi:hypothetical protein